jgi:hypothetical protein
MKGNSKEKTGGLLKKHASNDSVKLSSNDISKVLLKNLTKNYNANNSSDEKYISTEHKNFCKTGNLSLLTKPITSHSSWTYIPFKSLVYDGVKSLDLQPTFIANELNSDAMLNSFLEFNNYNGKFLLKNSVFNNIMFDDEWITTQLNYVYSLEAYDLFTLKGYTYRGDVLANNLLRGALTDTRTANDEFVQGVHIKVQDLFPLYFQMEGLFRNMIAHDKLMEIFRGDTKLKVSRIKKIVSEKIPKVVSISEWVTYLATNFNTLKHSEKYSILVPLWSHLKDEVFINLINKFISDVERIILKAPTIRKNMIVYRGVRGDFYLRGAHDGIYKNQGFISTSLDIDIAKEFQKPENKLDGNKTCCIQRIQLLKGTKTVFLLPVSTYPEEKEILINSGSIYHIKEAKTLKWFYKFPYTASTDICFHDIYDVNVSDIVLTSQRIKNV